MKVGAVVAVLAGLAVLAIPVAAFARSKARAKGDPDVEAVAAMAVAENGLHAGEDAHRAVSEVFWRNASAAGVSARDVLKGKGGALAPWPTATAYRLNIARARIDMLANEAKAGRIVETVKTARGTDLVSRGGTNWTHGKGPFGPWLEKGYTVVASFRVPSAKRPYLWIYKRPV